MDAHPLGFFRQNSEEIMCVSVAFIQPSQKFDPSKAFDT